LSTTFRLIPLTDRQTFKRPVEHSLLGGCTRYTLAHRAF